MKIFEFPALMLINSNMVGGAGKWKSNEAEQLSDRYF